MVIDERSQYRNKIAGAVERYTLRGNLKTGRSDREIDEKVFKPRCQYKNTFSQSSSSSPNNVQDTSCTCSDDI